MNETFCTYKIDQECSENCDACENDSVCLLCMNGFFVNSSYLCQQCDDLCNTCNITSSFCTSCFEHFYLDGNECRMCDSSCKECEKNASYCTECNETQYLYQNKCYESCSELGDDYYNTSENECIKCEIEHCANITYSDLCVCNLCDEHYYFSFENSPVCQECHETCLSCSSTKFPPLENECLTCYEGYILSNGKCLPPTNQFTRSNEFSSSDYFNSKNFSSSNEFSFTEYFTATNFFSFSNEFNLSNVFSSSEDFSLSSKFTPSNIFSSSSEFTSLFVSNIISYDSQLITFSLSYVLTYVSRKSVSLSASLGNSYSFLYSYLNGEYTLILTQTNIYNYFPYIIYYLSPSYTAEYITIEIPNKKRISREQFIGVVCGSTSIFFLILAVIVLIVRKKTSYKIAHDIYDDCFLSYSSENNVKEVKDKSEIEINKYESDSHSDSDDLGFFF